MTEHDAWDPDAYVTKKYSPAAGINADPPPNWQDLDFCWTVGADNIGRYYERGKLFMISTPDAGLPIALLEQLTGIKLATDDTVSMASEAGLGEISVAVNDRPVATGTRRTDGAYEWSVRLSERGRERY